MGNFNIEDLDDKMLNINKIMNMEESQRKLIIDLFDKLTKCFNGNNGITMALPGFTTMKVDLISAKLIYTSLIEHDFLITRREKRLDSILEK